MVVVYLVAVELMKHAHVPRVQQIIDGGQEQPEPWVPEENDPPRYSVDDGNPFTAFEGLYQDEVGQRASMVLYAYEDTGAIIEVSWADSAFATTTWTMYAEMAEDGGSFTYEACEKHQLTFTEDGDMTDETLYTDGTGSFVIYNNHIDWIDDQEDAGAGVRFVLVDASATGGI